MEIPTVRVRLEVFALFGDMVQHGLFGLPGSQRDLSQRRQGELLG
jgi:hypothetical protein